MATQFLLRRSDVPSKRPDPDLMVTGALNLNYDDVTGGVFYKNSTGELVKIGPAQVSATAPNATPAGEPGNSLGEFWYDTSVNLLKIWDGAAWQVTGSTGGIQSVTGTAPITVDNTDPQNPVVGITANTFIQEDIFTAKGALLSASAASTPVAIPLGTQGQILTVNTATATGLEWVDGGAAVFNGGESIYGKNGQSFVDSDQFVRVNFDNTFESNTPNLTYSSGVFTNSSTETRTFTFNAQVTSNTGSTVLKDFYIWFQKGSVQDPANWYGQTECTNPFSATALLATEWTFTLAPGEEVSVWTNFSTFAATMFGSAYGNTEPYATKAIVNELPTVNNLGLDGSTFEGSSDLDTYNLMTNVTVVYDTVQVSNIPSLTQTTGVFQNVSTSARTYLIHFTGSAVTTNSITNQAVIWVESAGVRYGQKVLTNNENNFINSTSAIVTLAPGASFTTKIYIDVNGSAGTFDLSSEISNAVGSVIADVDLSTQIKIVDLTLTNAQTPGILTYTQGSQTVDANTDYNISFPTLNADTLVTLEKQVESGNTIFRNISSDTRTYVVGTVLGLQSTGAIPPIIGRSSLWLQYNAIGSSGTNRIGQTTLLNSNSPQAAYSTFATFTLAPNEYFSVWFNCSVQVNIGVAVYGLTSGSRINIAEVTAIPSSQGTISGVLAGTNLSGGGFIGAVTLDLDSALTGITQISGAGIDIFGEGAAVPAGVTIFGGATTTSGGTGGALLVSGGGGTDDCTGGNLTLRGGQGNFGTDSDGGDVIITGGAAQGTGTAGTVQISTISAASATATYVPTAATDLATKAYVDASADGTVTEVNTGTGLTGGPITTTGTISLAPATTSVLGGVTPDGTTITIDANGVITAVTGGVGTVTQVNTGDGLTGGPITSNGTIALVPATTTDLGGVIPDGTSITVQPDGTISAVGGAAGNPAGSNTQIQYNDNGVFGASPNFTYDAATNSLSCIATGTDSFSLFLNSAVPSLGCEIGSTGAIVIGAGIASVVSISGGPSNSGNPASAGGDVEIAGGNYVLSSSSGVAGGVRIKGGSNLGAKGGRVTLEGGTSSGTALGGDVVIAGGTTVGTGVAGGSVFINPGVDDNTETLFGNVVLANEGGNVQLPDVDNVKITGGEPGQLLSTDGSGNLSWVQRQVQVTVVNIPTTTYTVTPDQVNATFFTCSNAAATTITLPSSVGLTGGIIYIKDVANSNRPSNPITINAAAGQTIDGAASIQLLGNYNSYSLIALANGWGIF